MKTIAKKHPLISYFVLAYLITWSIMFPLVATYQGWWDLNAPGWLHYLAPYGPMLSALVMSALLWGRAGLKDFFRRLFKWQVELPILLIAALSPFILFAIAMVIDVLMGKPSHDLGAIQYELVPKMGFFIGYLFITLTYGMGEEAGWRGFALPMLQNKYSAMYASMYLSLGWAGWHLPAFFYKENFVQMGLLDSIGWLVGLMFGTVFLTWLYNSSQGSILMVGLWHGGFNLFTASSLGDGSAPVVMSMVIMLAVFAIVRVFGRENLSHHPRQTTLQEQDLRQD